MKLRFLGGASEVGRSAILIDDKRRIMLDYGIKIDDVTDYPVSIPDIDAAIVSHAHLDHSGSLPLLYKEMSMPTFGTAPTLKLSNLLLEDSLKLFKKNHVPPKFHKRQLNDLLKHYISVEYRRKINFGNYDITFYDAGHITGSAITLVERPRGKDTKRIVYTGDFKIAPQMLHAGAEVVKSDLLVIESTYAGKSHPDRGELIKKFVAEIRDVLESGGNALVPAFAVGRSQELLAVLYKNGLADVTYVDGMSKSATSIVLEYQNYINNKNLLSGAARSVNWVEDYEMRNDALNQPSVILTTAGMLNGGPVLNYITRLNSKSKIFLTGYQVDGTNGRLLLENKKLNIDNNKVAIKTPVSFYDFSAHADNNDLYEFIEKSSPNTIACVHGDSTRVSEFVENLRGMGFDAYGPKVGDSIDIND